MNIFFGTKRHWFIIWSTVIILLSFASFWRILGFGFWKDDFSLIWSSLYNIRYYHGYFNHPGTPIEFIIFSHIFGLNSWMWESVGLIIHIWLSILVGIFIGEISSKKAGIIAGLFFAVSYLGLETTYYASVQVTQFAAIPLIFSLILFIRFLKTGKSSLWWSIFFFSLALFLDIPRIIPIVFILPFLVFIFSVNKRIKRVRRIILIIYPAFIFLMSVVFVWWFKNYSLDTLLGKAINQRLLTPVFFLQKLHLFGHFFATIANVFTGLIWGLKQDEQNTGVYNKIFAYIGFSIFLCSIVIAGFWIKTRKHFFGIITVFILWIFLFYVPNWISEPRAPMAGAHRYVFLSSIGFIGLISYLISLIKQKRLFILAVVVFVLLNIYKSNSILSWQYTYRSNKVVNNIWNKVNSDVLKNETNDIFMFVGLQPWVGQDIYLSGPAPFALLRKYFNDPTQMPIQTDDINLIEKYLCFRHVRINIYFEAYKEKRVPLNHIYAWKVLSGGKLVNISTAERILLRNLALKNDCIL